MYLNSIYQYLYLPINFTYFHISNWPLSGAVAPTLSPCHGGGEAEVGLEGESKGGPGPG